MIGNNLFLTRPCDTGAREGADDGDHACAAEANSPWKVMEHVKRKLQCFRSLMLPKQGIRTEHITYGQMENASLWKV